MTIILPNVSQSLGGATISVKAKRTSCWEEMGLQSLRRDSRRINGRWYCCVARSGLSRPGQRVAIARSFVRVAADQESL